MGHIYGRSLRLGYDLSSPEATGFGSLVETTRAGQNPIRLESGEERRFLEDGDELILSARTPPSRKFAQMGFGECRGSVSASAAAR